MLLTFCVCCNAAGSLQPSPLDDLAFSKKPRPVEFQPYSMVRELPLSELMSGCHMHASGLSTTAAAGSVIKLLQQ